MPVLPTASPFTLLIEARGAQLWSGEGALLAELPDLPAGPELRRAWGEGLAAHLPPGADVQLLLHHGNLEVTCQEVPFLNPKERREAGARLVAAQGGAEAFNWSAGLDPDAFAEGGHQLWVAGHPAEEMRAWLGALRNAKANLVFATPWQRTMLSGLGEDPAAPKDRLVLGLEAEGGHLLYFKGRGLVLQRDFRLPEGVDPAALDEGSGEMLVEAVAEELSRTVQYLKQKHRGAAIDTLHLVGVPELPAGLEERLGRGLRLKLKVLGPEFRAFLLHGAGLERGRKDALNLVPQEVLEARKLRALRLGVWAAAIAVLALCAGLTLVLLGQERMAKLEAERAEGARDQRRALAQTQAQVMRTRFPLLRLRAAEQRQGQAVHQLASLTETLFRVPEGVTLESLEIQQLPGEGLRYRFTVEGVARTRTRFSVGPLADYMARLAARPGLALSPQKQVEVLDGRPEADKEPDERALTRFTLEGTSP